MTKVSIFDLSNGADKQPESAKTPIEFTKMLNAQVEIFSEAYCEPNYFDNVTLLFSSENGYDIMMAWDTGHEPIIYKGYWNDGVVE